MSIDGIITHTMLGALILFFVVWLGVMVKTLYDEYSDMYTYKEMAIIIIYIISVICVCNLIGYIVERICFG